MTSYARSAYGSSNPNAGYPANGDFDAWGGYCWPGGVPSSLLGSTSYVTSQGQTLKVSMREEIVPLWNLAFEICDKLHGYTVWANVDGEAWGPWGYENRSISGSDNPSGHSAALSVDINAPYNPYSYTFECDMPPAMVADLESLGLYWGGRYEDQKYDPMHYGFCRAPSTVAGYISKAQALLGDSGEEDMTPDECRQVIRDELVAFFTTDVVKVTGDEMSNPPDYDSTRDAISMRNLRLTSIGSSTVIGRDGKTTVTDTRDELSAFFSTDKIKISGDEMSTPDTYETTRDGRDARTLRLTSIGSAAITGRDGKAPVPPK